MLPSRRYFEENVAGMAYLVRVRLGGRYQVSCLVKE